MGKKANWHKAKISFGLQNKKGRAQMERRGEEKKRREGKEEEKEEKRRRKKEEEFKEDSKV